MTSFRRKRCTSMPPANINGAQITIERKGSIPHRVKDQYAPNIPSITISPCDRLMMRITPNTIVSPIAIIAYSEPVRTPLTTLWTKLSIGGSEGSPPAGAGGDQAGDQRTSALSGNTYSVSALDLGQTLSNSPLRHCA